MHLEIEYCMLDELIEAMQLLKEKELKPFRKQLIKEAKQYGAQYVEDRIRDGGNRFSKWGRIALINDALQKAKAIQP